MPDDRACEHLLQINLLAQSGQKGERIEESFHPLEFKILIHLIERFPDLRRLHESPKRFVLGRKRIHEAKDEAHGAACYAKRHAHTKGHDRRQELDGPPEIMEK